MQWKASKHCYFISYLPLKRISKSNWQSSYGRSGLEEIRKFLKLWKSHIISLSNSSQLLVEWKHERKRNSVNTPSPQSQAHAIWIPPTSGSLKLNVDAAIFLSISCFGAGMCIRDENGRFLQARTQWNYGEPSSLEAEAWALLQGINWIHELVTKMLRLKLIVSPL